MTVKYHEKNQAVYFGLQTASGSSNKLPTASQALASVAITGTAGQFSCASAVLTIGQQVTISGPLGGSGTIAGYANATNYYIIATNGSTTFTLSTALSGSAIVTTVGTPTGLVYTAQSALGSTAAIACTNIVGDPTRETGSYQYLGDSLSRDEYTYEKDKYIDLQVETYQQVLTDMTTAIDPSTAHIFKLYQICGGDVIVDSPSKEVYISNATESPDYGTADYRKASPDDDTYDKVYKYWDLRGTLDVTASIGEVPSLKFALKGNADDPVNVAKQSANVGYQTVRAASPVNYTTIKTAQLIEISSSDLFINTFSGTVGGVNYQNARTVITFNNPHGVNVGEITRLRVAGMTPSTLNGDFTAYAVSATKLMYYVKGQTSSGGSVTAATVVGTALKTTLTASPFCFSTLTAPNFFGFDFARYQTGCDIGFAKGGVPTDVSVSMLEDKVGGTSFLPDVNASKFFSGILKFGTATSGTTVAYMWDKLQLANVKQGKIGTYLARDVTFRNTGSSFIFYQ